MGLTPSTARLDTGDAGAFLALCAGAVAMGVSPIFVRFAAADVGPFASAFWRVALALPVLYAWMRFEEAGRPVRPARPFDRATLLAGLAFSGDLFFWHLAILEHHGR
jgi:drug/metabolite transporter (DMT)-like permease